MTPAEARQRVSEFAEKVGREVRVFVREAGVRREEAQPSDAPEQVAGAREGPLEPRAEAQGTGTSPQDDEDDFYEFTAADYARVAATRKEEKFLKLRKHREQEMEERRSRIQQAVIRVLFPDNFIVESTFLPTHTVADVRRLIEQCLDDPQTPFYFFTAPPKKRIEKESLDLYTAQLAPGALIHLGLNDTSASQGSTLLSDEVRSLKDLHLAPEPLQPEVQDKEEPGPKEEKKDTAAPKPESSAAGPKKTGVPKWFKR